MQILHFARLRDVEETDGDGHLQPVPPIRATISNPFYCGLSITAVASISISTPFNGDGACIVTRAGSLPCSKKVL